MAAEFIQVTLGDFERHFSMPHKKDPTRRAFELVQPRNSEAYYLCTIRENKIGKLVLKVLTTCGAGKKVARACGKDAIRCYLVWQDNNGWEAVVGKTNRTYRSGGAGASADDVVKRTLAKCRVAAKESLKICSLCNRPMVLRESKNGKFYGCCGFKCEDCFGKARFDE